MQQALGPAALISQDRTRGTLEEEALLRSLYRIGCHKDTGSRRIAFRYEHGDDIFNLMSISTRQI